MNRRGFIAGLGAAGWPLLVRAQQQTKPTIGWLDSRPGGPPREDVEGFRRGLAEVGLSVGRDVTVEDIISLGTYHLAPLPPLPSAVPSCCALRAPLRGALRDRGELRPSAVLPVFRV
jgi:hypothetical protein